MSIFKYMGAMLLSILLLGACASKKDVVYFQGVGTSALDTIAQDYTPVLKADDQLAIAVSALDPSAAIPFNNFEPNQGTVNGSPKRLPYLIAKDGTIVFPQLGTIRLAGLTRLQAIALFQEKLRPFLQDSVVTIELLNFKITVVGEVKTPGTFPVKSERITVIEALGLAGDMTLWGTRENVLVIRESEAGKSFTRVDITAADLFQSPVYYLEQNDVVYVEPNKPKINNSATSATTGIIISITSLLITVISLIVR
jgi:polysaccharide export outer membrane protein